MGLGVIGYTVHAFLPVCYNILADYSEQIILISFHALILINVA